jgi:hypothetical protein
VIVVPLQYELSAASDIDAIPHDFELVLGCGSGNEFVIVLRKLLILLEAPPGFEPGMEVLQTSALPLGDGAGWNSVRDDPAASEY